MTSRIDLQRLLSAVADGDLSIGDAMTALQQAEILGPVCANSGIAESGIRVIDCIWVLYAFINCSNRAP